MTATPRKKPIVGILQILAVVAFMVLAFVYSREPDQTTVAAQPSGFAPPQNKPIPLVAAVKPAIESKQLTITSTGSVAVRSYVTLTSQVSGRVIQTSESLRNGGRFEAGETLVKLEPRDFVLALDQVQADVTSAQASLKLSEAEASVDITSYQRLNPGKKVPALIAKEPQIAQARAQLQAAQARRDIAEMNLDRSVYTLPFSGVVVESSADMGQMLTAGQSFGRVYGLDAVEIVISLAPEDLAKIAPVKNREVLITADGNTFAGRIDRVAAERNARTQFAQVFLTSDNSINLKPGTFVTVELKGPRIDNAFTLPESALQVGQTFWIVRNGIIEGVPARILGRSNGRLLVAAFDYADGIVTGTVPGAKDGMQVRLAEAN
jgi:RND family efflux transporter MFP subunit